MNPIALPVKVNMQRALNNDGRDLNVVSCFNLLIFVLFQL